MSDRFKECHAITAKWEGGWSNHPADPGGKTMYGITDAVWKAYCRDTGRKWKPVRSITRAEAEAVYRRNYWKPIVEKYNLRPGVDLATYDAGVNSGIGRARKWLMRAAGGTDVETVRRLCNARLSFVQALRTWKVFGRGWSRRIADIRAKATAMALAAQRLPDVNIARDMSQMAKAEKGAASTKRAAAAGSGTGGVAGGGATVTQPETMTTMTEMLVLGGCVALVLIAVYLIWRARQHDDAGEALQKEAMA